MGNLLKKAIEFISTSSSSRTVSVIVILIISAAIPLTVIVSQKQQETRQRAFENPFPLICLPNDGRCIPPSVCVNFQCVIPGADCGALGCNGPSLQVSWQGSLAFLSYNLQLTKARTLINACSGITNPCTDSGTTTDTSFTFIGLSPDSKYDLYVRTAEGLLTRETNLGPTGSCTGGACSANPTLTPTTPPGITSTPTPTPLVAPDLVIDSPITINGRLTAGQTLSFTATARNIGNTTTGIGDNSGGIGFGIDVAQGNPNQNLGIPPTTQILAGATQTKTSNTWIATVGSHTIWACADYWNFVVESNETNNCTPRTFTVTAAPTPTVTPGPLTPVPTTPPGITSTPTPTPTPTTPTPTIPPGNTLFALTIGLDGLGGTGDNVSPGDSSGSNKNPKHPSRNVRVEVFNSRGDRVKNNSGMLTYQTDSGKFTGNVDMGNLANGNYTVKVKSDGYLKRLIPGIQNITLGQTYRAASVNLVAGDINGDNAINILDYNILVSCSVFSTDNHGACNANQQYAVLSDLDDNGVVNQFDYNLFLREFSVQNGD